jgi:hypothetical protein
MYTRSTHTVRITNPSSPSLWVDVEVIDKVVFRGPNGEEFMYSMTKAYPYVLDKTGDGDTIGDSFSCSRASHMTRLVGVADPTQMIDVEVLDAIAFIGPNNEEFVLLMPQTGIKEAVVDNTGNNLAIGATDTTTRAVHIAELKELTDGTTFDTDSGLSNAPTAPATGRILLAKRVDAVAFTGPNQSEWLMLIPKSAAVNIDTTVYTTDSDGNSVPPENTDPNPYIRWPQASAGPWVSGVGAPDAIADPDAPIAAQGPLWWIGHPEASTIGVLEFYYNLTGPTDIDFIAGLSSPEFKIVHQDLTTLIPITLPPNIAGSNYWAYAPKLLNTLVPSGTTSTVIDTALYNISTNLGTIVSGDGRPGNEYRYADGSLVDMANPFFGWQVPLSTADIAMIGNIAGYLVDFVSFAKNGMVTADLVLRTILTSHTVTTTRDLYTKIGNIIVFFNLKTGTSPLDIILDTTGVPYGSYVYWKAYVSTYRKTRTFPVDPSNNLTGPYDKDDPVDGKTVTCNFPEASTPSFQTTFGIDPVTLAVTASRVQT